jgi:SLAP domain-containing protein
MMKQSNFKTRAAALTLALALILSSMNIAPKRAEAASDYVTILDTNGTANADTPISFDYNAAYSTALAFCITAVNPIGVTAEIYQLGSSTPLFNGSVTADDSWTYDADNNFYNCYISCDATTPGDYTLTLTFDTTAAYAVYGVQLKPAMQISKSSLILTKGFSSTLSAVNASGTVTWSSSNKKVAAVSSKGKVTAKAVGSATITASTADGSKVTCKVTVKANTFSRSKLLLSDCPYGNAYIHVYKISYSKKGDLVIKTSFVNNCGSTITKLSSIKISVKNKSGKVIGTYTTKNKKITILQNSTKSCTFTIKKSKLKIKTTQDLRNATIKPACTYTCSQN